MVFTEADRVLLRKREKLTQTIPVGEHEFDY